MNVYLIGNLTLDIIANPLNDIPAWGTEIFVKNIIHRAGGNLSNLAFAIKKIGLDPIIIGNTGDDKNGEYILKTLKNSGINTSLVKKEKKVSTSITIALVRHDGERMFITKPGQLNHVDDRFIYDNIKNIKNNSIVMLCNLFQFPNLKLKSLAEILEILKKRKCIILLDPGWDTKGWEEETISGIRQLLKFVDYFIPNEDEAKVISNTDKEIEMLKSFKKCGAGNIIIKRGPKGAIGLFKNKIIESKAYKTTCIDATGAGDAFNAAIIYCIAKKISYFKMLKIANATAAFVVSKLKNRYPAIEDINMIVKSN